MFGPKFASALSKALAARTSADFSAVAATVAAVAAIGVAHENRHSNSNEQQQSHRQNVPKEEHRREASFKSTAASLPSLPQTQCQQFANVPPQHHFSRLARRRTIEKMRNTSTKATLASKYKVDPEPLGEGAFGAVFLAVHRASGEQVAIKKINKKFTSDTNFQNEMEALLHIRQHGGHPNICRLRENFDEGQYYYLILDLVSGGEMFDHLVNQGPYSEADAARLIREVASALAFCHGIGLVHGDLKPENLMLSSDNAFHAVIKVVDFGCTQVTKDDQELIEGEAAVGKSISTPLTSIANTPAYCPPEILDKALRAKKGIEHYNKLDPSFDMWALGVILYIMLTGVHPFDLDGEATDEEIARQITAREAPPLRGDPLTAHLSDSSIQLIEQLMHWEPSKRLTAFQMLDHPWVRGETARTGKIADSDMKLSMYKAYKSKLEAKVFADLVNWSDNLIDTENQQQISLLERAFHNLDGGKRGYITKNDLRRLNGLEQSPPKPARTSFFGRRNEAGTTTEDEGDEALDLSGFSELLGENMKNRYFPKGHIVYREGDKGDQMFFINSGTIEVTTSDGHTSLRSQGDTFGEGALLHSNQRNTSTIKCKTPVHAIEISRNLFEKYMNSNDDKHAKINLSEKDRTRKRERAKRLLRMVPSMQEKKIEDGEYIFRVGDIGTDLYILEEGTAEVMVANGKRAFSLEPGDMCGEHATRYGTNRNTSVFCIGGEEGCKFRVMSKKDYEKILNKSPWWVKKSLKDISLRRDFRKAVVMKTGKNFPDTSEEKLRQVFDIADVNKSGKLELDNIREILHSFDNTFSARQLKEILDALDLDESGAVSFAEFKRMFFSRRNKHKNINGS